MNIEKLSPQMRAEWIAAQARQTAFAAQAEALKEERQRALDGLLDDPMATAQRLAEIDATLEKVGEIGHMLAGKVENLRAAYQRRERWEVDEETRQNRKNK
ncbi:hypothetical protein EHM76_00455 [bacterium]|nr:MAG: hypothetical protein EHM76_00455 [bacterium]